MNISPAIIIDVALIAVIVVSVFHDAVAVLCHFSLVGVGIDGCLFHGDVRICDSFSVLETLVRWSLLPWLTRMCRFCGFPVSFR